MFGFKLVIRTAFATCKKNAPKWRGGTEMRWEHKHTNASDALTTPRSPLHLKPFRVQAFCTQTVSSKHFHIHYRGVSCHTARDTPRWHARLGPLWRSNQKCLRGIPRIWNILRIARFATIWTSLHAGMHHQFKRKLGNDMKIEHLPNHYRPFSRRGMDDLQTKRKKEKKND